MHILFKKNNLKNHQRKCKSQAESSSKRILRKFGYPPDMQILATETVLKQAELIAIWLANRIICTYKNKTFILHYQFKS